MEPITLISTALTLATPYLIKTGESVAEKIGEDVWNLIKKTFSGEPIENLDFTIEEEKENLTNLLLEELNKNKSFKFDLEKAVEKGQNDLKAYQQNINNNGKIEKQINIQQNSGNIQM